MNERFSQNEPWGLILDIIANRFMGIDFYLTFLIMMRIKSKAFLVNPK
jgi:hypothetical protein